MAFPLTSFTSPFPQTPYSFPYSTTTYSAFDVPSPFAPSLPPVVEAPITVPSGYPVTPPIGMKVTAGGVLRPADWPETTFATLEQSHYYSVPSTAIHVQPRSTIPITRQEVVAEHPRGLAEHPRGLAERPRGPLTLTYFNLKARALFPMLVAEVGGIPYVWKKVAMEDWPALKPSTPFGQLPILEHGEITIAQSSAIASYIGRLAGLLGNEDADFAMSQMLVAQYEDNLTAMTRCYYSNNKKEEMEKYFDEKLPSDLTKLERLVSGGFTNERTIGELAIFCFLNIMLDLQPECLDKFPALAAFYAHLAGSDRVAAFLNGRCGDIWYKKDW